ncbi:TPA: hypothetical protein HA235_01100 [Candidatus Woesearchaeota archaeon]|nr:hypothetical protein [Candidatus Woesearchaeota archaeon]HIH31281.1 hypothetical protein [Candidatus Woesearchaeota archaeon]HIH54491.1 hypothetical protein [Candidatus Woesearchaeota archaeon]HIJ14495.1 hypothetical protein [Candidatus Woesearchaeota archaeon]
MKKILIFVLLLAGLVISGCGPTTTSGQTFIGGNKGLETAFLQGSPPPETFDGGQSGFAIVVDLKNIGEDDIKANEGYVKILGLDPGAYGGTNDFKKPFPEDIRGAKRQFDGTVLEGGRVQVDFGELKYAPVIQGNIIQKVWADTCYIYTTKTTAQLCIKKDPQLMVGNQKICDVEGEKSPQNSGAPIEVSSLKETFGGSEKLGITLVLSHKGTGDAFFDPREAECDDSVTNIKRGKVKVLVKPVKIGGRDVTPECSGLSDGNGKNEGYIRLGDGTGTAQYSLYCSIDVSSIDSIFEVPIDIETTYRYLQHNEVDMTIRHVAK